MLIVATRWKANTDFNTGTLSTGTTRAKNLWNDLTHTKVDVDTTTVKVGYLLYPTGTAATSLAKDYHCWGAVEDYAFRTRHVLEMPDEYENEFLLPWMYVESAANFDLLVKYSIN